MKGKEKDWLRRVPARVIQVAGRDTVKVVLHPEYCSAQNEITAALPIDIVPIDLRLPNTNLDILYCHTPHKPYKAIVRGQPSPDLDESRRNVPPHLLAHDRSSFNKDELLASALCGCFYCQAIFAPVEIQHWIDGTGGTALCPKCSVDSVIGSASGYAISKEFLAEMHAYWFKAI